MIGASDAGAHLDLLASFNYVTGMLQRAVRERGILPLEEAIHLMTDVQAKLYGLKQRGQVKEGWHADIVVLDPATVGTDDVAMRFDLPGGAGRLYADSHGIEHVFVNGRAIVRNGELTADRPAADALPRHPHPRAGLTQRGPAPADPPLVRQFTRPRPSHSVELRHPGRHTRRCP